MNYQLSNDKIVDLRNGNIVYRGKIEKAREIYRKMKRGYGFNEFTPDFFCQERKISV